MAVAVDPGAGIMSTLAKFQGAIRDILHCKTRCWCRRGQVFIKRRDTSELCWIPHVLQKQLGVKIDIQMHWAASTVDQFLHWRSIILALLAGRVKSAGVDCCTVSCCRALGVFVRARAN